jgi:hypothetical protein
MKKTAKPVLKLLLDKVEAGLLPKDQSRAALRKEIFTAFPEIDPFKKARVREMILCSEKGRNKKIIELKNLAETEIPQNSKAIEKARELGDLRENAEYKAAKERQQFLVAKIELLKEELSN